MIIRENVLFLLLDIRMNQSYEKDQLAICNRGLFLASCGSVQSFTFDELIPAETSFPEQLSTVAVVNNMVPIPSPKSSLLTLGSLEGDGKTTAESLANGLADSHYFRQVIICDSALQGKTVVPFRGHRMLTSQEVDRLSAELGVDMLFTLDRVAIRTEKKQIVYQQVTVPFNVLEVQYVPTLSVYIPGRERPMRVVTLRDSVFGILIRHCQIRLW